MKDSIVESVVNQFKQRSEVGIKKYNTTLDRTDLSRLEWVTHLSEELMDAILYIERLKKELNEEYGEQKKQEGFKLGQQSVYKNI